MCAVVHSAFVSSRAVTVQYMGSPARKAIKVVGQSPGSTGIRMLSSHSMH